VWCVRADELFMRVLDAQVDDVGDAGFDPGRQRAARLGRLAGKVARNRK
jgi:hypothetical protein